jgi:hypothetical protein
MQLQRTYLLQIVSGAIQAGAFMVLLITLFTSVIISSEGHAQSASSALFQLPEGTGPLPDLSVTGGAGVALSQPYAPKYGGVLPQDVAGLLANGTIAFEAALRSKVDPQLDKTLLPSEKQEELIGGTTLHEAYTPRLLPFHPPSSDVLSKDPSAAAYQVLWNSAALHWRLGYFEIENRVRVYQDNRSAPREVMFTLARLYPRNFGASPGKLISLFRERMEFTLPPVLAGVKWLTLRFLTSEEDYVWASSPTTYSVRQMTGSNRSDLIFPRGFSLDDLFVWSGKIEGHAVKSIQRIPVLVPIVQGSFVEETDKEGCTLSRPAKGAALDVTQDGRRVPQAPPWLPSNAFWTVRNTWKIELENKDPFSLDTRSVVYVDEQTYAPVYRSVFGKKGEPLRTTIGLLGPAPEGTESPIYWRGEIILNPSEVGATLLEVVAMKRCSSLKSGRELRDFDPKSLLPPTPTPSKRGNVEGGTTKAPAKPTLAPVIDEEPIPED